MTTRAQQDTHDTAVAAARGSLQDAIKGSPSAATLKAAHIAYFKAVLASGRTNGVQTGALAALHALGDAAGESGQAGDT